MTARTRPFAQVDVFGATPYRGNPVAVVLDAEGVSDDDMAAFARWTNLSETTFVLPPTVADADYRLRIFTPGGELPFAGHPTLGSAHAWLEAGGRPAGSDPRQECAVGVVPLRRTAAGLAFAAPPTARSGPLDEPTLARVAAGLRIEREAILAHAWVDNGPGWLAVRLLDADAVLALEPDSALLDGLAVGVIGDHQGSGPAAYEVRAFVAGLGVPEDPVTGSLNASIGQWLLTEGLASGSWTAAQGTAIGREGRIHLDEEGATLWVGGSTRTLISGTVLL